MNDDYKHHVTLTTRDRDLSGMDRGEHSVHLIGTEDEVAEHVASMVRHRLTRGGGPIVITPIHPVNVFELEKRR